MRNDREIKHMLRFSLGFVYGVGQHPAERQSERMRAVMRGDNAQNPFRQEKRFFLSSIFLAKHKKDTGPSAASASLWVKKIQRKGHVFSFSHSFFFLQKKEWEKKEKRHPRSLRSVSQRRLRRNLRRLASQRRLPVGDPTAGGEKRPFPVISNQFSNW